MKSVHFFLTGFIAVLGLFSGAAIAQPALNMRVTMYADGASCPGDCDAHVVLHPSRNGTRNAFRGRISDRADPQSCRNGEPCNVCFGGEDNTCLTAIYRGNGPHRDALDFTPAFFEENCAKPNLPITFAEKCRSLSTIVERLRTRNVNCFVERSNTQCAALMDAAERARAADAPFYEECRQLGEGVFNRKYRSQPHLQRRHACAYSNTISRSNSSGNSWVVLLPAACRTNTFVGRDGLDCCSSSVYAAAGLGRECSAFFPAREAARTR